MSASDWIPIISATIAFLSMVASIIFALKAGNSSQLANQNAQAANSIAIGQTETAMRAEIQNSRMRCEDASSRISEYLHDKDVNNLQKYEKSHKEQLESTWRSAIEGYLNAYEDACGKYLDNKTDKTRFKKHYINEIRNICDPKKSCYARLMHPDSTSNFQAIWKVYREWHLHE
ncbi:hypothetical protein [Moritella viscosa]|uniref:hypothetical protein n=1 Tax=Moritella viscosa TaxID=80854 RepID=UPI00090F518C|nr:hypothetical protein [Moritella viscosa]SGZ09754.1 Putative uncharacterized protein [Moritella viscosa]